jgi:hypothetical protein
MEAAIVHFLGHYLHDCEWSTPPKSGFDLASTGQWLPRHAAMHCPQPQLL